MPLRQLAETGRTHYAYEVTRTDKTGCVLKTGAGTLSGRYVGSTRLTTVTVVLDGPFESTDDHEPWWFSMPSGLQPCDYLGSVRGGRWAADYGAEKLRYAVVGRHVAVRPDRERRPWSSRDVVRLEVDCEPIPDPWPLTDPSQTYTGV